MKDKWSIAKARRRFSELIESSAKEPQPIYKRDRLVATLIDAKTFEEFLRWKEETASRSIADALDELGTLCAEEGYEIEWPDRTDRQSNFPPGSDS